MFIGLGLGLGGYSFGFGESLIRPIIWKVCFVGLGFF